MEADLFEDVASRNGLTPPERAARRLVEAVERGDIDDFAALFAEDAVAHHPLSPEPLVGRTAIRAAEQELFAAFSDVRVDVRAAVADSRTFVLEVVLTATNTGALDVGDGTPRAATGRRVEVSAAWWYEVDEDGLITGARDYFDTAAFLAQLA